jgi:adenine-specific DNA methylase
MSGDRALRDDDRRKVRGAYFTPPELCRYVADWSIRSANDVILEPSCGEAAFVVSAAERISDLSNGSLAIPGSVLGRNRWDRARR